MVALMRYTQKSEQRKRAVLSLSFLKVGNKWVSCMQVQCLPSGAANVQIICTAAYSVSTRVNVNLKTDEMTVVNF